MDDDNFPATEVKEQLISSFTEITSSSIEEARFFLEANEWNLDAAVSNFKKPEVAVSSAKPNVYVPNPNNQPLLNGQTRYSNLRMKIPVRRAGNIEIMCDLTIWKNGYTINDEGILCRFDIHKDAVSLQYIEGLKSPRKLRSPDGNTVYTLKIIRRPEEDFVKESSESSQAQSDSVSTETPLASSESMNTSPPSSMELVVDHRAPTSWIEVRFADGSGSLSQFNTHHTVRDVRGFIDASRPYSSRDYHLFKLGNPLQPLTDFDQTIVEAGVANSVLIHIYFR